MLCAKCMFWVLGNRCVLVGDLVVLYDFVVKGWQCLFEVVVILQVLLFVLGLDSVDDEDQVVEVVVVDLGVDSGVDDVEEVVDVVLDSDEDDDGGGEVLVLVVCMVLLCKRMVCRVVGGGVK